MRTFEVTFWEDSATCVGSAIIEAGSDDALRDKSMAYAKYVLVPQGFEVGGMKHHEVARGNTDGHISGCVPYRFFPILQLPQRRYIAEYVPYEFVKQHESQAMKNHGGQTVDRLPDPYNGAFSPTPEMCHDVDVMVRACRLFYIGMRGRFDGLRIEACAEPGLNDDEDLGVTRCGCVSSYDLKLLGLEPDEENDGAGRQRKDCLCYSGKVELLEHKKRCPHGCLYCYWR